jgi:hypothetical protein
LRLLRLNEGLVRELRLLTLEASLQLSHNYSEHLYRNGYIIMGLRPLRLNEGLVIELRLLTNEPVFSSGTIKNLYTKLNSEHSHKKDWLYPTRLYEQFHGITRT